MIRRSAGVLAIIAGIVALIVELKSSSPWVIAS